MGVVVPSMSRRMTRICGSSVRGTPVTWPRFAAECIWAPDKQVLISVHAAAGVVGHPAGLVLEQTNRANAAVSAEIEPMKRAARNTNQVASFHLNRDNRALLRMDVQQPTPGHDVTEFVLIVRMLYVELGEHSVQPGSIRIDV